MKFIKENSYQLIRTLVNQFGIMIFSMVLTMAVISAWDASAVLYVSIFAVAFYLFLIYTMMWEFGSKDIIRMESGHIPMDKFKGLKLALLADIPNAVFFVLLAIGVVFNPDFFAVVYAIAGFCWESMYHGFVLTVVAGQTGITQQMLVLACYFVALIPLPLVSHIAYRMGMKNRRLFGGASAQKKKETMSQQPKK